MVKKEIESWSNPFMSMPRKGIVNAITAMQLLQERFLAKFKALFYIFGDVWEAIHRVRKEVICWVMRNLGFKNVFFWKEVMTIYGNATTVMKSNNGNIEEFKAKKSVQSLQKSSLLVSFIQCVNANYNVLSRHS